MYGKIVLRLRTGFTTIFVFITVNQSSSLSLNAHVNKNLFFYLSWRAHFQWRLGPVFSQCARTSEIRSFKSVKRIILNSNCGAVLSTRPDQGERLKSFSLHFTAERTLKSQLPP